MIFYDKYFIILPYEDNFIQNFQGYYHKTQITQKAEASIIIFITKKKM